MADNMKNIICGPPEIEGPLHLSYSEYLLKRLKEGGDATAQISVSTGEDVTYAQILQRSINMAVSLGKLGVKKGDVIAISCENRFEFTVCAIGIMFAGAVNATLNVLYSRDELIHAMNISKPKMIFCSPFTVYNIIDAVTDIPSVQKLIAIGDEAAEPDMIMYEDLVKENVNVNSYKPVHVEVLDPLVILCSSGTTGLPKGVILTHHNFSICNGHLLDMLIRQSKESRKCLLMIMPWFHAYGFITHLITLNLHMLYAFMVRFEEEAFLKAIQDYKITITMLVPPLMVFLAKHPLVDKFDLSSIKEIWCGAAPLSKELQLAVTRRIGVTCIKQAYGLTETTLAVTHSDVGASNKYGSCGMVVPGTQMKVIDLESGDPLGANQEGELCIKGPMNMAGYIGDAASTQGIFDAQGWLHTGDIGYYDEDYFFYIVDRLKELIKYKAFQVPPAELEALLLQHPGIKDTGVVGLPDEAAGELPLAFVVRQATSNVTEKEIQQFVAERVSAHKRLRGGVVFVDEIPKNPSGKILRRELRDMLKQVPKSKL